MTGWVTDGRLPTLLAVTVLAAVVTGCESESRPAWQRETLGRAYFDDSGRFAHAGVSTRLDLDLRPLDPTALGADTLRPEFHLFRRRCGSCHNPPNPSDLTGEQWSYLIPRMKEKTETAGLLPISDAQADSILGLLLTHAKR
jgi:hypothetical protein